MGGNRSPISAKSSAEKENMRKFLTCEVRHVIISTYEISL